MVEILVLIYTMIKFSSVYAAKTTNIHHTAIDSAYKDCRLCLLFIVTIYGGKTDYV